MAKNQTFYTRTALAEGLLAGYIGGQAMVQLNLRDALALARGVESGRR